MKAIVNKSDLGRRRAILEFDGDGTLYENVLLSIFESRGYSKEVFEEFMSKIISSDEIFRETCDHTDSDNGWLYLFDEEGRNGLLKGMTFSQLVSVGRVLERHLYPGVPEFIPALRAKYNNNPNSDINVYFFLQSSGFKDVVDNNSVGKALDETWGIKYYPKGWKNDLICDMPRGTLSGLQKLRAVANIAERVNGHDEYYQNVIYVSDKRRSDRSAIAGVFREGGVNICVGGSYEELEERRKEKNSRKIAHFALADYTLGGGTYNLLCDIIEKIAERPRLPEIYSNPSGSK